MNTKVTTTNTKISMNKPTYCFHKNFIEACLPNLSRPTSYNYLYIDKKNVIHIYILLQLNI